jgi:hypothetical protein
MHAGDPQVIFLPREDLQIRRTPQRSTTDEHVFQTCAGSQIAEHIPAIRYAATAPTVDAEIQIIAGPRKPPRLRVVGRGRCDARAQDLCFG